MSALRWLFSSLLDATLVVGRLRSVKPLSNSISSRFRGNGAGRDRSGGRVNKRHVERRKTSDERRRRAPRQR